MSLFCSNALSESNNLNLRLKKLLPRLLILTAICSYAIYRLGSVAEYANEVLDKDPKEVEQIIDSNFKKLMSNFASEEQIDALEKIEGEFLKEGVKMIAQPSANVFPQRTRKTPRYYHSRRSAKKIKEIKPAKPVTTFVGTYKCITLNGFTEVYDENGKFLKKFENKFQSYRELATLIEQIKIEQKLFAEE